MGKRLKSFLLFLTVLSAGAWGFYAVTGCGGGTSAGGSDATNPTLPYVVSVSPAGGSGGVPVTPTIQIVFSKAMDPSSINSQTFSLVPYYDVADAVPAIAVDVNASYDPDLNMALFSVASSLAYRTAYIATVNSGVKDVDGNSMASDYSWTFTTVDGGGSEPATKTVLTAEPDENFGSDGMFTYDFGDRGNVEYGSNVVIQPDSKILVSSYINWTGVHQHDADLGVIRVDENGVLDPTFGIGGAVEVGCTSFWGDQWWMLHGLALQSDGKILLGGECQRQARIFRLNADGSPDLKFNAAGTPGYAEIASTIGGGGGNWAGIFAIAMQPDGVGGEKIIIGGIANAIADWDVQPVWLLARFNIDGTLDATFGDQGAHPGIMIEDWGTVHNDGVRDIVVLPNREIIAYGNTSSGVPPPLNTDFGVARYTPDGVLDTKFASGADADGIDGFIDIDFGGMDWSYSIARADDGKLVGGVHVNCCAPTNDFGVFRLTSDGALDPTFGTGGKVQIDFGLALDDIGNAIVVLPDGSVIAGGQVNNGTDADFGLVKLGSDGTIDTDFGTDGFIVDDFFGSGDAILKMKLEDVETDASGAVTSFKILAVGAAGHPGEDPDLAIVRYVSVAREVPVD